MDTNTFLTQRRVFATVRALGLSIGKRDGEYRITFKGLTREHTEASAYYTTDVADAYYTACTMRHAMDCAQS